MQFGQPLQGCDQSFGTGPLKVVAAGSKFKHKKKKKERKKEKRWKKNKSKERRKTTTKKEEEISR